MKKTDAAKFLNIGVRTLERHTSDGAIQATREKGPHGYYLDYAEEELTRFKSWLDAQIEASPQGSPSGSLHSDSEQTYLAVPEISSLAATLAASSNDGEPNTGQRFVNAMESLAASLAANQERESIADLSNKFFLTVQEAALLAGVGKSAIEGAIKAGYIKPYSGLGRGRRVKRADVEKWAKAL